MKLNETAERLLESGQWTPENIVGKSFQIRSGSGNPKYEKEYPHWFLHTVKKVNGDQLYAVTLDGKGSGTYDVQEFIGRIVKEVPAPQVGEPSPALKSLSEALDADPSLDGLDFSISTTDYSGISGDNLGGRTAKIMIGCEYGRMWAGGITEDPQGRFSCWGNAEELQLDDATGLDAAGVVQKLKGWLAVIGAGGDR